MTADTEELVSMVESLPVDVKTILVERILASMRPTTKEVDDKWVTEVERRISDVNSGAVQTIPGDEVFAKIRERFGE